MKQEQSTITVIFSLGLLAFINQLKPHRLHWKHFITLYTHIQRWATATLLIPSLLLFVKFNSRATAAVTDKK